MEGWVADLLPGLILFCGLSLLGVFLLILSSLTKEHRKTPPWKDDHLPEPRADLTAAGERRDLKECPQCFSMIDKRAKICPNCRKRQPTSVWSTLLLIVLLIVLASMVSGAYRQKIEENKVTYENYLKVADGMTYAQVCDILGEKSKFGYSMNMTIGDIECLTNYYYWYAPTGAYCLIAFQDDKVVLASEVNLQNLPNGE